MEGERWINGAAQKPACDVHGEVAIALTLSRLRQPERDGARARARAHARAPSHRATQLTLHAYPPLSQRRTCARALYGRRPIAHARR